MVEGINSFREKFRGFEDCYTVIGGAACDILMSEAKSQCDDAIRQVTAIREELAARL